jgi:hypothetical protein
MSVAGAKLLVKRQCQNAKVTLPKQVAKPNVDRTKDKRYTISMRALCREQHRSGKRKIGGKRPAIVPARRKQTKIARR